MPILSWFFHQVMRGRLARFARDLQQPLIAQGARLAAILAANRDTEYAKANGLDGLLAALPAPLRRQVNSPGRMAKAAPLLLSPADALRAANAFREAAPITTYADYAAHIAAMQAGRPRVLTADSPRMYALTSGTASAPKHIPIPWSHTREHHASHLLWMYHFQRDHPGIAPGPYFTLVSPAESAKAADGTPIGASSGQQALDQSIPVKRRQAVPYVAFTLGDYGLRHHAILVFALGRGLSAATSVNPSSLVFLGGALRDNAEALLDDVAAGALRRAPRPSGGTSPEDGAILAKLARRLRPRPDRARALREIMREQGELRPRDAWPGIAAIATWQGGSAPFYRQRARELWGDAPMRCLGLRASEGIFTIPLADHSPSGVLAVGGAFLEFVPESAPLETGRAAATLLAHELEKGERYRLVATTSGGLYRYDMGDIIEVTGFRAATPEAAFLHRAGGVLSVTGEKVTEDQVVAAVQALAPSFPPLAGFAVTFEHTGGQETPRYVLAVEWGKPRGCGHLDAHERSGIGPIGAPGAERETRGPPSGLEMAFDAELSGRNGEYAEKRASGRLAPPVLLILAEGSFAGQRRAAIENGRPEGQVKPPHLFRPAGPGRAPVTPCAFFSHVRVQRPLVKN